MRFSSDTATATKKTDDSWKALDTAANSVGLNGNEVVTISESFDLSPSQVIPKVAQIEATKLATPGASLADVMSEVLLSGEQNPGEKTTKAKKNVKAKSSGSGSPGLFTDIVGDIFEVMYPWIMLTLGAICGIIGLVILLAGIAKSPLGNVAVGAATKAIK
jgi:hypothetical protein